MIVDDNVTIMKYSPTILEIRNSEHVLRCSASGKLTLLSICRCNCVVLMSAGHTERIYSLHGGMRDRGSQNSEGLQQVVLAACIRRPSGRLEGKSIIRGVVNCCTSAMLQIS